MQNKFIRTFITAVLSSTFFPCVFLSPSLAEEPFQGSVQRIIAATPYDHKLSRAGVLSAGGYGQGLYEDRSAESLFWTARSFRYVADRNGDRWQSAEETESRRSGDCEDKAIWLYTRLKRAGHLEARLVIGKYRSIDRKYHVWVSYVDDSGQRIILDPAIQRRPWKSGDFSAGFYKPFYSFDGQNRYRHQ